MLRIYPIILLFVEDVAPFMGRIARCDPDLARQLRRSSAAVVLNTAEGMYARGRSRQACYNVALREMRESYAALEVSVRLGYIAPLPTELEHRIAQILGTLVRAHGLRSLRTRAGTTVRPGAHCLHAFGSMRRTSVPMTRLKSAATDGAGAAIQPSASAVSRRGCICTAKAVGNTDTPKSRMWGPQVRFRGRGPGEIRGPYPTTSRARR